MKHTAYRFAALVAVALCLGAPAAQAQGGAPRMVKATATATKAVAGKPFTVTIAITVDKPYHIQGNPTKEGYIATVVKFGAKPGVKVGKITYPKAIEQSIAGDMLAVYEGAIEVKAEVTATKAGKVDLPITVNYQACNDRACFPPAAITTTARVVVAGKPVASIH